jgi:hypothetical protein
MKIYGTWNRAESKTGPHTKASDSLRIFDAQHRLAIFVMTDIWSYFVTCVRLEHNVQIGLKKTCVSAEPTDNEERTG